ncbi:unnamed protein product (plasmid) [Mycetohabitans rhizoxinica HKI 454]|uniref:Uncharacterized protein n=1 Tax=Mycetohabitans rhizoxinica (strain DSM 19002 / CIP 109453 / HKI 454) TaxID=882378 RepID=E5AV57_MYCRK|nr:unnamed protein product [Mycetohabitans rhizoxinica HKI 454]
MPQGWIEQPVNQQKRAFDAAEFAQSARETIW